MLLTIEHTIVQVYSFSMCGEFLYTSDGIGIRERLKISWSLDRAGSSPVWCTGRWK